MTLLQLSGFLGQYGLALLLPLAVIEGPVVSVLAGVLCSLGVLHWYQAYPLLVLGDLIGDLIYYGIGRGSQGWLHALALRLHLPVRKGEEFAARMTGRSTRLLLIGKWTHAIGALVLIAAGAARIGLPRFLLVNLIATLPKSALLMGVGDLVGANFVPAMNRYGVAVPILVGLGVVGAVAAVLVLRRRPDLHRLGPAA